MKLNLMSGENIVWESHEGKNYRSFILIRDVIFFSAFAILIFYVEDLLYKSLANIIYLFILGTFIITALANQIKLMISKYVVTDERVIIKRGLLNKKLTSINLENIIDTKAEQKFFSMLIRSGRIYFFTANDSQNNTDSFIQNVPEFRHVDDPFKLHSFISEHLKNKKDKRNSTSSSSHQDDNDSIE